MKLYLILFFVILISIFIFYIINLNLYSPNKKSLFEKFIASDTGASPSSDGSSWTRNASWGNVSEITSGTKHCIVGSLCNNNNGFGLYNEKCECLSYGQISPTSTTATTATTAATSASATSATTSASTTTTTLASATTSTTSPSAATTLPPPLDPSCYPNNTNFDAKCKSYNPKYGIKNIIKCTENEEYSKVICGLNYLDGIDYGIDSIITPCLNKSDDFDVWCKYYNNQPIPSGYNVNSIGAKSILEGTRGGCFLDNGDSDINKARAVCDYNHIEEINKLEPANISIDYNKFTKCSPLKNTNFISECNNLLNDPQNPTNDAYADQIMGYDCNPGYGRAKCIKHNDRTKFDPASFDASYTRNDVDNNLQIRCDTCP